MSYLRFLCTLFVFCFTLETGSMFAQGQEPTLENIERALNNEDYALAQQLALGLLKRDPRNKKANLLRGQA